MIRSFLHAALAALILSAMAAAAAPQGGGPGRGARGPRGPEGLLRMLPVMQALDANGDGQLSAEEIAAASEALRSLDADGDGRLTEPELLPRFGGFGPGGGRGGGPGGGPGAGPSEPVMPADVDPKDGAAALPDRAAFGALSYRGSEVMIDTHLAGWEFVKFQIEGADSPTPRTYFINTKTHRAHMMFMRAAGLEELRGRGRPGAGAGSGQSGAQMRGVLVYRPLLMAPDGSAGLYTFEFEPNDAYPFDLIRVAFDQLGEHAPLVRGKLSYNLLPRAREAYLPERAMYDAAALPVFDEEDLYGDVAFLPLHPAVAFGRLRLMDGDARPAARDIVIYRALPNEMPRVAGVMTAVRQTPLSHVNLRAIQDDVPNAYVAGAARDAGIQALLGKYVRYEVSADGYDLREASAEEVEGHFAAQRPREPLAPTRDLGVREIRPLRELRFEDAASVGVKAANLATLGSLELAPVVVPSGFAVPFSFYDAFMAHHGLYAEAKRMMADPGFRRSADARDKALKAFRKRIKTAKMPEPLAAQLEAVRAKFPVGASIRARSSTNNEDLPGFSGAGLYDSYTHKKDEGPLTKSVQQVFASLWNFRAFEEREYFRVDHMTTAMGVVLHEPTKGEPANGVAVTRDVLYQTEEQAGVMYYVNAQLGDNMVTNPENDSVPEELLLDPRRAGRDRLVQRSNRVGVGQSVLTGAQLEPLRKALGVVHDEFARRYGASVDTPFAMEVEFKVLRDGRVSIKQARPWVF